MEPEYCPSCGVPFSELHKPKCSVVARWSRPELATDFSAEAVDSRITRDEMFFEICEVVRKRSTCKRGKVGCVIVKDNRIVAMGYNGSPPGAPHCIEIGCDVEENNHEAGCQRTIHAEANAIAHAARVGISTEGGTLYTTHSPCLKCAQLLVSAGIIRVLYTRKYRRTEGSDLLRSLSIECTQRPGATDQ